MLACVIKPFVTAAWWHKALDLIEQMARKVPCYVMRFDKSEEIVGKLSVLVAKAEESVGDTRIDCPGAEQPGGGGVSGA